MRRVGKTTRPAQKPVAKASASNRARKPSKRSGIQRLMAAQPDSGLAYTVLIEPDPVGGFTARFPALRGCGTQGDTFEQTLEHAKEALGLYIETLREMGWPLPPDSGTISLKMSL